MTSYVSKIASMMLTNAKTKKEVTCESLWKDTDVVFYFLRRFGCPLCRWISNEISLIKPQLDANNVKLIGVAPEEFGMDEFVQGNYFKGDLYLDESKKTYELLDFSRFSLLGAIGAAIDGDTRKMNNDAKKIGISGNIKGDVRQLGGLLIVKKGGEQLMHFKQVKAADYVKNSEILKTLGISEKVKDSDDGPTMCTLGKDGQEPQCS